jgi:hypothetical protein
LGKEENLDEVFDGKEEYHYTYVVVDGEQKLVVVLPFSDHIVAVVLEVTDFEGNMYHSARNTVVKEEFYLVVGAAAAAVEVVVEDKRFALAGDNFFRLDNLILEMSRQETCHFHFRWTDHVIVIEQGLVFPC